MAKESGPTRGRRAGEIPSINVHGRNFLRQPLAETSVIPQIMFPALLLDWSKLFDAEFVALIIEADEILKCVVGS